MFTNCSTSKCPLLTAGQHMHAKSRDQAFFNVIPFLAKKKGRDLVLMEMLGLSKHYKCVVYYIKTLMTSNG